MKHRRQASTGDGTRWHLTDHTTPSGGTLWQCAICGRLAEVPSVDCNRTGHAQTCAQEWRSRQQQRTA
jgi:hypothetical protein